MILRPMIVFVVGFSLGAPMQRFLLTHQPTPLVVTVVDSLSRQLLPNADVADLIGRQSRITDDQGRAYLVWPSDGKMQLRVRQIGYQPRQISIERSEQQWRYDRAQ